MPRHKHADVIIAWANGEEIEFRAGPCEGWVDIGYLDTPAWFSDHEYRIKPKTVAKKGEVVIYKSDNGVYGSCFSFGRIENVCDAKVVKRLQVEWEEEV